MIVWLVILGMALGSFALRTSFILLYGRVNLPAALERALRFVPPAVMAGLILPAVLTHDHQWVLSLANPRLWGMLAALLVAYKTRNILFTIGTGMLTLWVLQALWG